MQVLNIQELWDRDFQVPLTRIYLEHLQRVSHPSLRLLHWKCMKVYFWIMTILSYFGALVQTVDPLLCLDSSNLERHEGVKRAFGTSEEHGHKCFRAGPHDLFYVEWLWSVFKHLCNCTIGLDVYKSHCRQIAKEVLVTPRHNMKRPQVSVRCIRPLQLLGGSHHQQWLQA